MEHEASYDKKVCDAKRFIMCFHVKICIQNLIFHEKKYFITTLYFILKLNFIKRQASDLMGRVVCFIFVQNINWKKRSLSSICSLLNPDVPGLLCRCKSIYTSAIPA